MRITDYKEALRALCRVGSGTVEATFGTFYGTLDAYEWPGDSEREYGCMYLRSSPLNQIVYEDQFIALEIPDSE